MRSELQEPGSMALAGRKLRRLGSSGEARNTVQAGLEPLAVDAAFSDDSMATVGEAETAARIDRRDTSDADGDDALLRSLSEQLDLLDQQQREIRRLISRAGRRRLDRANW